MKVKDLLLQEQDGVITLDGERIVLTSSAIFGTLRKDLTENLGSERMKGFLMRYGWNLGATDARKALKHTQCSLKEVLKQGAQLHRLKGYTNAETTSFQVHQSKEGKIQSIHVEGIWRNSYEAEEYIRIFEKSYEPVCHTLIGYASGFYSTICEQEIYFKEVACQGRGDPECRYIGKTAAEWGVEAAEEKQHFENRAIIKELEKTYEQLLEERNRLTKAATIHKKLADEIINGNNLNSIARVMFEMMNIPILIEDLNFKEIASAGLLESQLSQIEQDMEEYQMNHPHLNIKQTTSLIKNQYMRVMTPIILQNKTFGYCSFIYEDETNDSKDMEEMILERAATVCSLYVLSEKTTFETEERVKGYFLSQLLTGKIETVEEILKRGTYYNLNLRLPYHVVVFQTKTTEATSYVNEEMMKSIVHYFKNQPIGVLVGQHNGNVVLLIQASIMEKSIEQFFVELMDSVGWINANKSIRVGISTESDDIQKVQRKLEEALTALKIGHWKKTVISFDQLSLTGMLMHMQNKEALLQKAYHMLNPILRGDEHKAKEMLRTLYVFLMNGGNLEQTMKDLAISMSGLRYRIEKIESLLNKNLRDPETSYELIFVLKVLIIEEKLIV